MQAPVTTTAVRRRDLFFTMEHDMGADWSTTQAREDVGGKSATGEWLLRYDDGEPIRSLNSRFAVNICFTNRTSSPVELVW